jgi:penicillin-binding protein-related factor A (putative recombinase)
MPVPYGYGQSTLDYLICMRGYFLAIEAKAPGKKPTDRQKMIMEKIRSSGGVVFVIDGDEGLAQLEEFLESHKHAPHPHLGQT